MQVIWINVRRWIDLKAVIVLVCVLEQAVHGIKHFVRQQQEPFPVESIETAKSLELNGQSITTRPTTISIPGHSSVIEAFLASENDVQPSAKFVGRQAHDLMMRIFEQRLSVQSDLDV